ncbi:MAG: hypothetical protein AB7F78_24055 [Hyphomicrobiaceae bacterium]
METLMQRIAFGAGQSVVAKSVIGRLRDECLDEHLFRAVRLPAR